MGVGCGVCVEGREEWVWGVRCMAKRWDTRFFGPKTNYFRHSQRSFTGEQFELFEVKYCM